MANANGVEKVSSPTGPCTWIGNSSPTRTSAASTQNSASSGPMSPAPARASPASTAAPAAVHAATADHQYVRAALLRQPGEHIGGVALVDHRRAVDVSLAQVLLGPAQHLAH